ncbi:PIN domain-containing protein [Luedemannella helvata]|uniref:PIN domain-containing protein n=1 Tax=Luedemannella helvata TaxID=349315 RepID=A0ABP4WYR9_9ACTN
MTATLVLDTSAAVAYMRQSLAMGELLAVVDEDDDTVILPATCLAEAAAQADDAETALLRVLAALPGVAVTPLAPDTAIEVGRLTRRRAGLDLAHAVVEAVGHDAQLASAEAAAARKVLPPGWGIIEV